MKGRTATLGITDNHYSVLQIGDLRIKFYTSPFLEKYHSIDFWNDCGYMEYTAFFSTSSKPIEDSIDFSFIAERLHLGEDVFKGIEEVRIV